MNGKTLKFMICVIVCAGIVVFWAGKSYCDSRPYPHIHIKGRITTADGQGVADVLLSMQAASGRTGAVQVPFVTGMPSWVEVLTKLTESTASLTSIKTSANGEYHILLQLDPIQGHQPEEVDVSTFSIDRSKMAWKKDGYSIKSR